MNLFGNSNTVNELKEEINFKEPIERKNSAEILIWNTQDF